ncbi:hypothetical protein Q4543_22030 [Salipiger sp. 1_MG-2023]|uniref:hypothetical protein n=1 Tax=Salipiger sp. 1_MG-2023 TaxID=3062665 RepID=UPI0026E12DCC|nr:hypothetical protein [Salipiger sp. 1_MG-2023]MDO6588181.1 hypothetical protein [Salipiger sp. 1_MG-2023]
MKTLIAAAFFALTAAASSEAATYAFTYEFASGQLVYGSFEGDLDGSGTIILTGTNATLTLGGVQNTAMIDMFIFLGQRRHPLTGR